MKAAHAEVAILIMSMHDETVFVERALRAGSRGDCRHACDCQRNPLLVYFGAGGQALHEALVLAPATTPGLTAGERDAALEELNIVLHIVAHREIEAFCGLCQFREDRSRFAAIQAEPASGTCATAFSA
ncbi:MAG: hypothetical protein ACREF9_05860 [Opitutaceae bacterium]